jgi:hypothetical protein
MITLPVVIVDGSATFERSKLPSDAVSIVIDVDKVTVYQQGDVLPE